MMQRLGVHERVQNQCRVKVTGIRYEKICKALKKKIARPGRTIFFQPFRLSPVFKFVIL